MSELITRNELAEKLNVTYTCIYNWTREKRIPFIKVGRGYRYELEKVIKALNEHI